MWGDYIKRYKVGYIVLSILLIVIGIYMHVQSFNAMQCEILKNMTSAMMSQAKPLGDERFNIGVVSISLERIYECDFENKKCIESLGQWLADRHYYERESKKIINENIVNDWLTKQEQLVVTDGKYEFILLKRDNTHIKIIGVYKRRFID